MVTFLCLAKLRLLCSQNITGMLLVSKRNLLYAASSNHHRKKSLSLVIEYDFAVDVFYQEMEMNTTGIIRF